MLTDRCQIVIDEALTALDNSSKLSSEASSHLASCLECRRSLEAIKALKASTTSVIPALTSLSLKNKIATNLESQLQTKSVLSNTLATSAKNSFGILPVVLGIGITGVVSCGLLALSSNSGAEKTPIVSFSDEKASSNSVSTGSINLNIDMSLLTEEEKQQLLNKELKFDKTLEDQKNHEEIERVTQKIPSSISE